MSEKSHEQNSKILLRICFAIFILLSVITTIEAIGYIGIKAKSLLGNFSSFQDYYAHLQQFDGTNNLVKSIKTDFKRDPFFGYSSRSISNNYGLRTRYDFPLKRNDNVFYIGIFGGSVAEIFYYGFEKFFIQRLKEKVPSLRDKEVTLVNLAMGAYKQPQQYIIFSFFFDQLDMAVQLDGWNEIFVSAGSQYPIEYPCYGQYFFSDNEETYWTLGRYSAIRSKLTSFSEYVSTHPPLNYSATLFLVAQMTEQYLKEQADEIGKVGGLENKYPRSINGENQIEIWARYLKMQHVLAKSRNFPLFSFIQPSQYAHPGKKLTENELSCCYKPDVRPVDKFNLLRKKGKGLSRSIPLLLDLNEKFVGEQKEMYIDDCCHLSEMGNSLMAERMTDFIAAHYAGSKKSLTAAGR